jgi:hypothetical protein
VPVKKESINSNKFFNKKFYLVGFIFLFLFSFVLMPSESRVKAYFIQDANSIFTYSNNEAKTIATNTKNKAYIQKETFLEVNFHPLENQEISSIDLELPDKEVYKVIKTTLEKRSQTNYTWRGKIFDKSQESFPEGFDVILTVVDEMMTGLIYTPQKNVYQIVPINKNSHKIVLLDQNKFPDCHGPVILPEEDLKTSDSEDIQNKEFLPVPKKSPKSSSPEHLTKQHLGDLDESENPPAEDANSRIDVLMLYSKEAISEAGGMAQAKTHAQGSIDSANASYANSNISTRLNLVGFETLKMSEFAEYGTILSAARADFEIGAIRASVKADLVCIMVSSSSSSSLCGLANLTSSSSTAFSVVNFGCAIGNLTFAHELGHNMGCQHNPENAVSPIFGAFPFSFGHYEVRRFRTIMGTASPNDPCGNCTRLPFFSNPNVKTGSLPTGIANKRDNAFTINQRAAVLANFNQSGTTKAVDISVTPSTRFLTQGQSVSYTLSANRTDFPLTVTASVICVSPNDCPVTSNLANVALAPSSTGFTFTIRTDRSTPIGTYQLAVKATAPDITIQDSNTFLLVVRGTPSITAAVYTKPTLKITGSNFEAEDKVMINGKDLSSTISSLSNGSISLRGSKKKLNLVNGTNTVSILTNRGEVSNTFTFNF